MRKLLFGVTTLAMLWGGAASATATSQQATLLDSESSDKFIAEMVDQHGFTRSQLETLFTKAELRPSVIERMTRPAEAMPWYRYRRIFMKENRIAGGAKFWVDNASTLARAEAEYGVAAEVIVAIIGVETLYGEYRGKDPVLESVATLAFDYPKRAEFFRSELREFLLLAREEGWEPLEIKGSYAGAMGLPQFISSSYRRLAVDFDGDGKRDLLNNNADAIGSVANYLSRHGWARGETVSVPARASGAEAEKAVKMGLKPNVSLSELAAMGIEPRGAVTGNKAALVKMQGEKSDEYWLGLRNFYAITRYNHSPLYALAVHQLSEAVRDRYLAPERDLERTEQVQLAKLQRLLKDSGHDPGPVDGLDGPRTRAAIQTFQQASGLPATGIDAKTLLQALAK
jgi:membrane-bound lytic murein transglycosylase B